MFRPEEAMLPMKSKSFISNLGRSKSTNQGFAFFVNCRDKGIHQFRRLLSSQALSQVGNQFLWSQFIEHFFRCGTDGCDRIAPFSNQFLRVVVTLKSDMLSNDLSSSTSRDISINCYDVVSKSCKFGIGETTPRGMKRRRSETIVSAQESIQM